MRLFIVFVTLSVCVFLTSRIFRQMFFDRYDIGLESRLLSFQFPKLEPPTDEERKLAKFGRQLFYDLRLSTNGEISCASCHRPQFSFADSLRLSVGVIQAEKNTPPLINLFSSKWFSWDGRADSIIMQLVSPFASIHHLDQSRFQFVNLLFHVYRREYEENFEKFPALIIPYLKSSEWQAVQAGPSNPALVIPPELQDLWDDFQFGRIEVAEEWTRRYQELPETVRDAMNVVFFNGLKALVEYQKGLVARNSPFDRFIERVRSIGVHKALNEEFGEKELNGFKTFIGDASCHHCHSGPFFTDHDFHQNGLAKSGRLSLGRVEGLLHWASHPLKCANGSTASMCADLDPEESARTLALKPQTLGTYKTPTLRNLSLTAPYMHDGSYQSLDEVIDAYHDPILRGLGYLDPSIVPLSLSKEQKSDLLAFLQALTSDIEDLTAN